MPLPPVCCGRIAEARGLAKPTSEPLGECAMPGDACGYIGAPPAPMYMLWGPSEYIEMGVPCMPYIGEPNGDIVGDGAMGFVEPKACDGMRDGPREPPSTWLDEFWRECATTLVFWK